MCTNHGKAMRIELHILSAIAFHQELWQLIFKAVLIYD
jgi:hypothetical protein